MSLPNSTDNLPKQSTNVYTVMLFVAFLSLLIGCIFLALELRRYGPEMWNTRTGRPSVMAPVTIANFG